MIPKIPILVFIILASMFVSSSVNNIISVTTALDDYFEMADAPDYFAASTNKSSDKDIYKVLENASAIDEFRIEEIIYMSRSSVTRDGKPLNASGATQILQSDSGFAMNYFLDDGSVLKSVPKGEVYATYFAEKNAGLRVGDKITVEMEGISREFTFGGSFKDAVLGSEMVNMAVLITVLMERSFIAKEKTEIALMKAMGMRNSRIYAYHTARFFIAAVVAVIAAELLGMPLTKLCIDPVFGMMGLEMGVEYVQNSAEIYAVFPVIVLAATVVSAFFTSLYTRKIKSSDTASIE